MLLHQGEGGRTADLFLAGGFGLFVVGFGVFFLMGAWQQALVRPCSKLNDA